MESFAIGDIPDVTDHDGSNLVLHRPIYHGATGFVFQVPRLALLFGQKAVFPSLESSPGF